MFMQQAMLLLYDTPRRFTTFAYLLVSDVFNGSDRWENASFLKYPRPVFRLYNSQALGTTNTPKENV